MESPSTRYDLQSIPTEVNPRIIKGVRIINEIDKICKYQMKPHFFENIKPRKLTGATPITGLSAQMNNYGSNGKQNMSLHHSRNASIDEIAEEELQRNATLKQDEVIKGTLQKSRSKSTSNYRVYWKWEKP